MQPTLLLLHRKWAPHMCTHFTFHTHALTHTSIHTHFFGAGPGNKAIHMFLEVA